MSKIYSIHSVAGLTIRMKWRVAADFYKLLAQLPFSHTTEMDLRKGSVIAYRQYFLRSWKVRIKLSLHQLESSLRWLPTCSRSLQS